VIVKGGWPCPNPDGAPSWDVEVFRLNKNRESGFPSFDEDP
jgi:hypothetical protein